MKDFSFEIEAPDSDFFRGTNEDSPIIEVDGRELAEAVNSVLQSEYEDPDSFSPPVVREKTIHNVLGTYAYDNGIETVGDSPFYRSPFGLYSPAIEKLLDEKFFDTTYPGSGWEPENAIFCKENLTPDDYDEDLKKYYKEHKGIGFEDLELRQLDESLGSRVI